MLGTRGGGGLWCVTQNLYPGQESFSSYPSQHSDTALCMQSNMSSASQVRDNEFGCR